MGSFAQNATIVLVHGAWADGSCWHKVILPLRKEGLQVTCAPIPLTSLTDDIATLQRVLERTSGPAILVGHAYGGAVIAGPNDSKVRSLVYIAALAPAENETNSINPGFVETEGTVGKGQILSRAGPATEGTLGRYLAARSAFCAGLLAPH